MNSLTYELILNSWPKYFKDRLILGNPNSDSAIATLWTPMNVVAGMVDVSKLSIIGQLYTKRGINYLLRNVLLNPRIRRILLVGADLMGSGEALKGLALAYAKARPFETDWIDEQINEAAIKLFTKNVEVINKIGPVSGDEVKKFVAESKETSAWADPQAFPEPEAMGGGALPSEETLFPVRGEKMWQAWLRMLQLIMRFGRPSPMIHHYGRERITELLTLSAAIYDEDPDKPDLPSWFPYKKDDVDRYIKGFLNASRGDEAYTYGERLKAYPLIGYEKAFLHHVDDMGEFRSTLKKTISGKKLNQQQLLAEKLKSFPENKGAIAVLWEPTIDNFGLREVWRTPCLVLVQAMIRDGRLFLTAYFRSNDMYGGWPLNIFGLRAFQKELTAMIDQKLKLGPLTTISHSAHIYESSWQQAEKLVHDHWTEVSCQWDPRGNLNVETDGKMIVVKHLSPDGIFLDEYRHDGTKEKAARDLCFQLESAGLFSMIGNAMYAARQIERAETAIKLGIPFVSDQALDLRKLRAKREERRTKRRV